MVKEQIKGKNEADLEELIKLLQQHMAHPDRNMRRGSGRRGPRTRSLCVSELEKLAIKNEQEENNNETNATTAVPSTQVPAEAP